MTMQVLSAYQGRQFNRNLQLVNFDGSNAAGVYNASTILVGTIWEGQNQSALVTFTPTWFTNGGLQTGYDQGQVSIAISAANTLSLDPAGEYFLLIDTTTGLSQSSGWEGRFKVLATPGSTSSSPPDLITLDYAEASMSEISLSDTQRDFIPYLVNAASQAVRKYCLGRFFSLNTWTEFQKVALDGQVRLYQPPVQQVIRVQGNPQKALTIQNTSSAVQYSQALFSYTGQFNGYGSNAQTPTGITLNWASSGTINTTPVSYTAGMTIAALATAINAVGSGWTATAADSTNIGLWPVTELDGGYVAQGCSFGATPGSGAQFVIYQDLAPGAWSMDVNRAGFLWVGSQSTNSNVDQWGPGGGTLWGSTGRSNRTDNGRIKATYAAGEAIIPPDVQHWTAQLVKWKFELMKQELLLLQEKAADYSYQLSEQMVAGMPKTIREGLFPWRLPLA